MASQTSGTWRAGREAGGGRPTSAERVQGGSGCQEGTDWHVSVQGRGVNVASVLGVQSSLIGALLGLPSDLETAFLEPVGLHSIGAGRKRPNQAPDLHNPAQPPCFPKEGHVSVGSSEHIFFYTGQPSRPVFQRRDTSR